MGIQLDLEQTAIGNFIWISGQSAIQLGMFHGFWIIGNWHCFELPSNRQFNWEFYLAFKAIGSWKLYLDFGRLAVGIYMEFEQSLIWNFIRVSKLSAVAKFIWTSGQSAAGIFSGNKSNEQLGTLSGFLSKRQLGIDLDFGQSAVGNSSGFRAIGN